MKELEQARLSTRFIEDYGFKSQPMNEDGRREYLDGGVDLSLRHEKELNSSCVLEIETNFYIERVRGKLLAPNSISSLIYYKDVDKFLNKYLSETVFKGYPMEIISPQDNRASDINVFNDSERKQWEKYMKEHLEKFHFPLIESKMGLDNLYEHLELRYNDLRNLRWCTVPAASRQMLIRLYLRAYFKTDDFYEYSEKLNEHYKYLIKHAVTEKARIKLATDFEKLPDMMAELILLYEEERVIKNKPTQTFLPTFTTVDDWKTHKKKLRSDRGYGIEEKKLNEWYTNFWDNVKKANENN